MSPLQEDAVYDLPSDKTYQNVGQATSSSQQYAEPEVEFDNPLYTDTGPVSLPQTDLYESVSLSLFMRP